MKTLKSLALLFAAAFPANAFSQSAGAAPCCTVQAVGGRSAVDSGRWSSPATWGGTLPAAGARVSIPAGMDVVLDTNPPALKALFVEGKLRIAPRDTQLAADWVMIHGLFEAGTAASPFKHRLTITLNGKNKTENVVCSGMPMGAKFVSVMNGGRLSLHAPPATAWSRLAADTTPGARQIIVADARGWQPGDTIVIAPRVAKRGQTEKRVLLAVNGSTLTLDKSLSFHHSGTMPVVDGRTLDMRSEVGRLDRRIVIQGDADSTNLKFGGHVMIMAGGSAQVDGVELRRMGQFNKLGRYPFHWHLLGDAPGQYLRNSSVHSSFQRGVVIHGTRQTLVENNVVFDTPGHNYSIEDSTATDNLLHNNLALENRVISLTEATLREQGDNQAANFWIRSARNTFTGNVAAGSMANGFWYDQVTDGPTVFRGNTAHSGYALSILTDFVRDAGLLVTNVGEHRLEFSDSLFYQNVNGIWPNENGAMNFKNIAFADHWRGPAMTMDTVGENTVFEDNLFVGKTREPVKGEVNSTDSQSVPPAMLIQYSGLADVRNPVFANYGDSSLLSANDILLEWQAQFFLSGVRLIGTAPGGRSFHEQTLTTLLDTSYGQPPGTYVFNKHPQLAPADSQAVILGEDGETYLRMPERFGYSLLRTEVLGGDYFSQSWHQPGFQALRSDGMRFTDGENDQFIDGFCVICGGRYRYALEQAPPTATFFVRLDDMGPHMPAGIAQSVIFSIPLDAAPKSVARIDELNDETIPAPPAARLTAAPSMAAFSATPHASYFYDPAARRLHLQADARWLVISR